MCLAIPMKIEEINDQSCTVEMWGVRKDANLSMLEDAQVGDYVLIHAGFAIQKLDEAEALKTIDLFKEMLDEDDKNQEE